MLGIAAGVAVAGLAGLAITNPGNVAETSADAKDENLRTRHYQVNLNTFVEETKSLVSAQNTYGRNWKIASVVSSKNSAAIKAEVPVTFFTDDLEINAVEEAGKDEITVNARSASRVGSSDLGENKRHISQILSAMDEKLAAK